MDIEDLITSIIVGAIIGYVTNHIAILMLFKPYKKWKIWSIPVPFTPGIIPRTRDKIAFSIGKMVGGVLLNEETIKNKLNSEIFRSYFKDIINNFLKKELNKEVKYLSDFFPETLKVHLDELISILSDSINTFVIKYFKSEEGRSFLKKELSYFLTMFFDKKLNEILSKEQIASFSTQIVNFFSNNTALTDILDKTLSSAIKQVINTDKSLKMLLPDNILSSIEKQFLSFQPEINNQIAIFLQNPKLKEELTIKIQTELIKYINSLNFFESVVAGFVGVEKKIKKDIPVLIGKFINDLIILLRDKETQNIIQQRLLASINTFLNKTPEELLYQTELSDYSQLTSILRGKVESWFQQEKNQTDIGDKISLFIINKENLTINELLSQIDNKESSLSVNYFSELLVNFIQENVLNENLKTFIEDKLRYFIMENDISSLNDAFSDETKDKLVNIITTNLIEIIYSNINNNFSEIFVSLDLKGLVEDKVNNFPIEDVENLILLIIKRHLKWINIFGGILGGIIGALQVFFQWLKITL